MTENTNKQFRFFEVVADGQTYMNILYLLLMFPLGTFYFTFLVTGLSLGIGLLIIWVGIPILLFMMLSWWTLSLFERQLANSLLNTDIEYPALERKPQDGLWDRFLDHLRNPFTWKGLAFLFLKFPLGIAVFVLITVLGATSMAFVAAPFTYDQGWISYTTHDLDFPDIQVDTFGEAVLVALVGVILLLVTLHICNLVANFLKRLSEVFLSA
jgi:hypothetical protein